MKFRTCTAAAIIAASSIVSSAHAQSIRDSFTYQGTLQDGGAPANGLYDITFLVYPQEVGGSVVFGGIQSVPNVEVIDGRFTTEVDFGVTGEIFDSDQSRWLELRVSPAGQPGSTTLAPRTKITPAALANYALRSGTSLQDAYNNAEARIDFDIAKGPLNYFGSANQEPVINFYNSLGDIRASIGNSFSQDAGYLALASPQNTVFLRLEHDISAGGGAFMLLTRNDSLSQGIVLEGNVSNSENARVSIFGNDNAINLNTNSTGDLTVAVPVDAINSTEMLNEAGAAETEAFSSVLLSDDAITVDVINSVTINAPADGFVLVLATAEVTVNHSAGFSSSVLLGVSDSPTAFDSNTDIEIRLDADVLTGPFDYPFTAHAIYPVTAGANTFYFLGDDNSTAGPTFLILDRQLTAIYFPTSYGSIARSSGNNIPDEMSPITMPLNSYDLVAEKNASLQADLDRQQREIQEMRELMNEMKRQLDQQNRD
jgi:hypothetical protein